MSMSCNRCNNDNPDTERFFCSDECEDAWQQGDYGPNHELTEQLCPDCGGPLLRAFNVALTCPAIEKCGYVLCSG
jgi:hypothetical protein